MASANYESNRALELHNSMTGLRTKARPAEVVMPTRGYDNSKRQKTGEDALELQNKLLDDSFAVVSEEMAKDKSSSKLYLDSKEDPNSASFFKVLDSRIIANTEPKEALDKVFKILNDQLKAAKNDPQKKYECSLFDAKKGKALSALLFACARIKVSEDDGIDETHVEVRSSAQKIIKTAYDLLSNRPSFSSAFNSSAKDAILDVISAPSTTDFKKLGLAFSELNVLKQYNPYMEGVSPLAIRLDGALVGGGAFSEEFSKVFQGVINDSLTKDIRKDKLEYSADYDSLVKGLSIFKKELFNQVIELKNQRTARFDKEGASKSNKDALVAINDLFDKASTVFLYSHVDPTTNEYETKRDALKGLIKKFILPSVGQEDIFTKQGEYSSASKDIDNALRNDTVSVVNIPIWAVKDAELVEMVKRLYADNAELVKDVKVEDADILNEVKDSLYHKTVSVAKAEFAALSAGKADDDKIEIKYLDENNDQANVELEVQVIARIFDKYDNDSVDDGILPLFKNITGHLTKGKESEITYKYGTSSITAKEWSALKAVVAGGSANNDDVKLFERIKTNAKQNAFERKLSATIEEISKANPQKLKSMGVPTDAVNFNRDSISATNERLTEELEELIFSSGDSDTVFVPNFMSIGNRNAIELSSKDWKALKENDGERINTEDLKRWFLEGERPATVDKKKYDNALAYLRERTADRIEKEQLNKYADTLSTSFEIYNKLITKHGRAGDANSAWRAMKDIAARPASAEYKELFGDGADSQGLIRDVISDEHGFTMAISKNSGERDKTLAKRISKKMSKVFSGLKDANTKTQASWATARRYFHEILASSKGVVLTTLINEINEVFNGEDQAIVEELTRELGEEKVKALKLKYENDKVEIQRKLASIYPKEVEKLVNDARNTGIKQADELRKVLLTDDPAVRRKTIKELADLADELSKKSDAKNLPSKNLILDAFEDRVPAGEKLHETKLRELNEIKELFNIVSKLADPRAVEFMTSNSAKLTSQSQAMAATLVTSISNGSFRAKQGERQQTAIKSLLTQFEKTADKKELEDIDRKLENLEREDVIYSGKDTTDVGSAVKGYFETALDAVKDLLRNLFSDPEQDAKTFRKALEQAEQKSKGGVREDNMMVSLMKTNFETLANDAAKFTDGVVEKSESPSSKAEDSAEDS